MCRKIGKQREGVGNRGKGRYLILSQKGQMGEKFEKGWLWVGEGYARAGRVYDAPTLYSAGKVCG